MKVCLEIQETAGDGVADTDTEEALRRSLRYKGRRTRKWKIWPK
jgi:hypothetical protein